MATIEKRENSKGELSYRVRVRVRGRPAQTATFDRLTDAKRWAKQTEVEIDQGRYFKSAEARKHTFGEFIDRYLKDVAPTRHDQQKQEQQLGWWRGELGDYLLSDLTPDLIGKARDKLKRQPGRRGERLSPSTVVRYMAALSKAFNTAVKEWGWLDDNPMRKVTKPKEPRGRVRFLSEDERKALLESCKESQNKTLYPVVVLAISTGARRGEILGLNWDSVDLERGLIFLHHTKNKERRTLPARGLAHGVLKEWAKVRRIDTDLVFPGKNTKKPAEFKDAWEYALKRAGIEDFKFHDLRHTAASYLAMNGATLAEIAEILGHKTLAMVKRYAHLTEQHTAAVVERMNREVFGDG